MSARQCVLQAVGVSKTYGSRRSAHPAVAGVDLTLDPSVRLGIVGESGSGKSTLGRILVGLEAPTSGSLEIDGRPVAKVLRSRSGYTEFRSLVQHVAQDTTGSFDPLRPLIDSVTQPLLRLRGISGSEAQRIVSETLVALEIDPALATRRASEVSGGQRQRFALARALVVRPRLLICDEVVSALDVSVQGVVLNLIKDYCETYDVGLVFISHGLPATGFIASEIAVMKDGLIVERGPVADVFERPRNLYTQSLLSAHQNIAG